jgi:hypothetical protein
MAVLTPLHALGFLFVSFCLVLWTFLIYLVLPSYIIDV